MMAGKAFSLLHHVFEMKNPAGHSVVVIGGADGPTSIFLAGRISHLPLFCVAFFLAGLALGIVLTALFLKRRGRKGESKDGQ